MNNIFDIINNIKSKSTNEANAAKNFVLRFLNKNIDINNTQASSPLQPSATPLPQLQAQILPGYNITKDQENKVLATILAEAQAEGTPGMHAVLNVVNNRIGSSGLFGGKRKNVFEVVSEPKQFSAFSVNNKIYTKYRDYLRGKEVTLTPQELSNLETVKSLYQQASLGNLQDLTNGANQYYNPSLVNPSWANQLKDTVKVGNHLFGKL